MREGIRMEAVVAPQVNRRIGQAMHQYAMLSEGDRVLVAVSGGVDSLVLAWLLQRWREKAPIHYTLEMVHIDMGFAAPAGEATPIELICAQLAPLGIEVLVESAHFRPQGKASCFHCAKQRRKQLFDRAARHHCNKIAFGHHKDDLIETLLLNMVYSGNISTMVPRQDLFGGRLSLIRPLAHVEKSEILEMARRLGIVPVANPCPLAGDTRRDRIRALLAGLYGDEPASKASLFAAMSNVRKEYLP